MTSQYTEVKPADSYPWKRDTPIHRWYALGRYYAMFPSSFAYNAVRGLTRPGEHVLDPFCGRGNGPFSATVLGRPATGIDINPIAWLYTAAKLQPAARVEQVLERLGEIDKASRPKDRKSRSPFETMLWSPNVRAFLRAARRHLKWGPDGSEIDRTLMAFIALHMQDKEGAGLSNVLWPTIACSPTYAVKWWTREQKLKPPKVDPAALLEDKIRRRYEYGVPQQSPGTAILGDSRTELDKMPPLNARLLITSPPYCGVTDYWNDHWLRLWVLGYRQRKDWRKAAKFSNKAAYQALINDVFLKCKKHLAQDASILVRSDQRRQTSEMCIKALQLVWPGQDVYVRSSKAPNNGVSNHHGRGGHKAKEIDLLIPGNRGEAWLHEHGFRRLDATTFALSSTPPYSGARTTDP